MDVNGRPVVMTRRVVIWMRMNERRTDRGGTEAQRQQDGDGLTHDSHIYITGGGQMRQAQQCTSFSLASSPEHRGRLQR